MGKFVIECPRCGKFAEASTGFFAKRKITCSCGYTIDVKTDKMSSRVCPHSGNTVIFDQSKGSAARCPVCGQITERESHCGEAALLASGVKWMNNDAVNFLSNLFSLLLAYLLATVI